MAFVDWILDTLASEDIIDLYFILSDLVDIELTEEELGIFSLGDAMARDTLKKLAESKGVPLGKLVL